MKDDNVVDFARPAGMNDPLTELLRSGAKQLIEKAVEFEVKEVLVATARHMPDRPRMTRRTGWTPTPGKRGEKRSSEPIADWDARLIGY